MAATTESEVREACLIYGIPDHMHDGVVRYIVDRVEAGNFLMNVMQNKFVEAIGAADHKNAACLRQWADLLYNGLPQACWGSPEKVERWLNQGILKEHKEWIDAADYETLLNRWRHSPAGDPMFQGKTGNYYRAEMKWKEKSIGREAAVEVSRRVGW